MLYQPKMFERLIGVQGFSHEMLSNHFKLYEGYVQGSNQILETLIELAKNDKMESAEYSELKRRLGWELNGMRLHELYFGNMTKRESPPDRGAALIRQLARQFGSFDNWMRDFKATANMRGIGWAALYLDTAENRLLNLWIDEHNANHLSGAIPLLVLDVFEHAFTFDYGLKKKDYIEAFFHAIDWAEVQARFEQSPVKVKASSTR